jgi:ClpP class serine protease
VHTDVVSRGRNAGWLSSQRPFTDAEREAFRGTMEDIYRLFTAKVAAGRGLELETVKGLAEGRVFTGRQALESKLVDRLGTLDDAIDEARKLAKIAADEKLDPLLLPEPRGLFDDLFGTTARQGDPVAALLLSRAAGVPALEEAVRGTHGLRQVLSGRPQLLPPARITVD